MCLQHNNARPHTSAATSETNTASNLKLFCTLSTAWIWQHLASGCSQLSKKHLKSIHFTCDENYDTAMGTWFREKLEEFDSDILKKNTASWWCCMKQKGDHVEK